MQRCPNLKLPNIEYRLLQKERKNDQDDEERSRQNPDAAEVAFDVGVIGVELGWARRIDECRRPAHLPSVFLCHLNLLLACRCEEWRCQRHDEAISHFISRLPRVAMTLSIL